MESCETGVARPFGVGALGIIEDAMLRQGDGRGNYEYTHEKRKDSAPRAVFSGGAAL